jgi:bile acid:Na+ symporter, BASS family
LAKTTGRFRTLAWGAFLCGLATVAAGTLGQADLVAPLVIVLWVLLATYLSTNRRLAPYALTVWVAAFVSASMFYPATFLRWGDFELSRLIVPLIQIIMFGMGTQLTLADFFRVFSMPRGVLVGMALQFSVMPFVGKGLATIFTPNPEVAAGMVLIGSCPGGVASNVMTYLARGNVALSVTMTSCSTLAAPLMTPLMTGLLAGTYVEVRFVEMMLSIINMIIVPIVAGLLVNALLTHLSRLSAVAALISTGIMRYLPLVSMFSICFIIGIITALSRDDLLAGGFVVLILVAVALHNAIGYLLGYWGGKGLGLSTNDARTVAIEVGLQNGGMASGLAIGVLRSQLAALPPAVFGPWMNMTGAALASWWAGHPPSETAADQPDEVDRPGNTLPPA